MSSSGTDTRPPPDPQSRTPLNLTVPVSMLTSAKLTAGATHEIAAANQPTSRDAFSLEEAKWLNG
jgi:hypothetical protein